MSQQHQQQHRFPPNIISSLFQRGSGASGSSSNQLEAAAAASASSPFPPAAPPAHTRTHTDPTSMDQDEEAEARRQHRLAKNRESARQSRARKKENLETLQEKVHTLNEELEGLRLQQVAVGTEALGSNSREKIVTLAVEGEQQQQQNTQEVLQCYGPAAEERQALRQSHFARLRRLLLPPHARFWLWLHRQEDRNLVAECQGGGGGKNNSSSEIQSHSSPSSPSSFAASASTACKAGERLLTQTQPPEQPQQKEGGGGGGAAPEAMARQASGGGWEAGDGRTLWPLLSFELQLKAEQEEKVRTQLGKEGAVLQASGELEALAALLQDVDLLEEDLASHAQSLHSKLETIQKILSPAQLLTLEGAAAFQQQ